MVTKQTSPAPECAESFDVGDEFHQQLSRLNSNYGAGYILAVVFSNSRFPNGCWREGMAVIQLKNGMTSKRFSVELTDAGYHLKFLGKHRHIESDYFLE